MAPQDGRSAPLSGTNNLMSMNDCAQTINSTSNEVAMPISWLSDLQEHIKQLKEMNDYQRDEVYKSLNMLGRS